MNLEELYQCIKSDPCLSIIRTETGETPGGVKLVIQCADPNRLVTRFSVDVAGVTDTPWDQLRAVLHGQRDARVMTHITRIVGYYSQVHNWNKSKQAELRDRQKGNYSVPDIDNGQTGGGSDGGEAV